MQSDRPDEELLRRARVEPEAFGAFYRRHEDAVLGYMLARTRDPELAADLTAETFAAALLSARRFRPGGRPAVAWLFGIARNVLGHSRRRRQVEDRARRRLALPPLELDEAAVAAIERVHADAAVEAALARLPADQARAVRARVLEDCDYDEIAARMRCSPQVARKRVSRGLAALRAAGEETP
ncbi:MAG TPA: sigma-70 family RNA polymerase sigma factor [Solirubrobacteraceae bacterium]|nr:sigma-70 family RNA polymerase sigma factor [Solirubrobacteraceae bacterium]